MPYPNEHAARVKEPYQNGEGVFARKMIAQGIDVILQKKSNSSGPMEVQSYRFKKQYFTADQARQWLKKHKISVIAFEPASF